jgi:hypothetical protein
MPEEQANIYLQRAAECEALARHYENTPLGKYFWNLPSNGGNGRTKLNDLRR